MTPYKRAWLFYGPVWRKTLLQYASRHYVYSSPTAICLAKRHADIWWIEYFAGDMQEAFGHLPFWLPKISFMRRGKRRLYWTALLINKILPKENCQNTVPLT